MSHRFDSFPSPWSSELTSNGGAPAPGKNSLTQRMTRSSSAPPADAPIQRDLDPAAGAVQRAQQEHDMAAAMGFLGGPAESIETSLVQLKTDAHTGLTDDEIGARAAAGVSGAGTTLPHLDAIQRSFGSHDVSGVRAHVGGAAAEASSSIGAHGYATGNDVAFASQPDLFLAAHEAAHVVQQRQGVALKGAVGQDGDAYEQHADAVAAAVVRGESAEELLGEDGEQEGGAVQRQAVQRSEGPSSTPEKKLSGAAAAAYVAKMLPKFQAMGGGVVQTSFGPVQFTPGTIWQGYKMLIHGGESEVYYTSGDAVYYQGAPQFVRDQWYGALGKAGQNSMGMVYLAKLEATLLEGIFVPWWGMLGLSLAEAAVFYETHQEEAQAAWDAVMPLLRAINEVRKSYPILFKTLVKQVLVEAPSGISASDVAFFVGRFIGGAAGATVAASEALAPVALSTLAKIALKCATLVTLTHAPSILAGAASTAAKKQIEKMKKAFDDGGLPIDLTTATAIMVELSENPDEAKRILKELGDAAEACVPVLDKLKKLAP